MSTLSQKLEWAPAFGLWQAYHNEFRDKEKSLIYRQSEGIKATYSLYQSISLVAIGAGLIQTIEKIL